MKNPNRQLRDYLDGFKSKLIYLNSILKQVNQIYDWIDEQGVDAVKAGGHFYGTVLFSYKRILTIEACKLLNRNENRNLYDWLDKAYTHAKPLEPKVDKKFDSDPELLEVKKYRALIEQHQEELEDHTEVIDNLFELRNNGFAHAEKEFFGKENKLEKDFPVSWDELNDLFQTISNIYKKHHSLLFLSGTSLDLVTGLTNVKNVLEHTRAFKRVFDNERLKEEGIKLWYFMEDEYNPHNIYLKDC